MTVILYTREQFRDITQSPDWAGGCLRWPYPRARAGGDGEPREFERVLLTSSFMR